MGWFDWMWNLLQYLGLSNKEGFFPVYRCPCARARRLTPHAADAADAAHAASHTRRLPHPPPASHTRLPHLTHHAGRSRAYKWPLVPRLTPSGGLRIGSDTSLCGLPSRVLSPLPPPVSLRTHLALSCCSAAPMIGPAVAPHSFAGRCTCCVVRRDTCGVCGKPRPSLQSRFSPPTCVHLARWHSCNHAVRKILFLGLDNAGKTTLLHMLKENKLVAPRPTQHPNKEELILANIRIKAFDLGGHLEARRLWRDYFTKVRLLPACFLTAWLGTPASLEAVDGIIYLVDAADPQRFSEAKKELDELLSDETLRSVPFAILGNKVDIPTAVPEEQLMHGLGLVGQRTGKQSTKLDGRTRPLEIFMCSVMKRAGYGDAFKWVSNYLANAS
eukprot:gene8182-1462_t